MATLQELRMEAGWGLKEFAGISGVSVSTLAHIETCSRQGISHPMQAGSVAKITRALRLRLGRSITVDDIDDMHLQAPKTGRPRRKKSEE
jgi:transcriptional regulator with XRE-family HTH domain